METIQFGKEVVRLTEHLTTQPYWRKSSEHLISILGLYIFMVKYEKEKRNSINYNELIKEVYSLLKVYQDWKLLAKLLLSTKNEEFKTLLKKEVLFQNTTNWVESDIVRNNMILIESQNRIKFLYEILNKNVKVGNKDWNIH